MDRQKESPYSSFGCRRFRGERQVDSLQMMMSPDSSQMITSSANSHRMMTSAGLLSLLIITPRQGSPSMTPSAFVASHETITSGRDRRGTELVCERTSELPDTASTSRSWESASSRVARHREDRARRQLLRDRQAGARRDALDLLDRAADDHLDAAGGSGVEAERSSPTTGARAAAPPRRRPPAEAATRAPPRPSRRYAKSRAHPGVNGPSK